MNLVDTFHRGVRRDTSKLQVWKGRALPIFLALIIVPFEFFEGIRSFVQSHSIDSSPTIAAVDSVGRVFNILGVVGFMGLVMIYGIQVLLYFRKNNISGNLPIAKVMAIPFSFTSLPR